jgi:hypothetical protein
MFQQKGAAITWQLLVLHAHVFNMFLHAHVFYILMEFGSSTPLTGLLVNHPEPFLTGSKIDPSKVTLYPEASARACATPIQTSKGTGPVPANSETIQDSPESSRTDWHNLLQCQRPFSL